MTTTPEQNIETPASACMVASDFLNIIKGMSNDRMLLEGQPETGKVAFDQQVDEVLELCKTKNPSLAVVKEIEDFLGLIYIMIDDCDVLMPNAPAHVKKAFIRSVGLAGVRCSEARGDIAFH